MNKTIALIDHIEAIQIVCLKKGGELVTRTLKEQLKQIYQMANNDSFLEVNEMPVQQQLGKCIKMMTLIIIIIGETTGCDTAG